MPDGSCVDGRRALSKLVDEELRSRDRLDSVPHAIGEATEWGAEQLARCGVDASRLDGEILLAHALNMTRTRLYALPGKRLTIHERSTYLECIRRRSRREPIAYITGHKAFYGLDVRVDPRVLVPRPETELLVEEAIRQIDAQSRAGKVSVVVDVGTGSGVIAVSLAVHYPALALYAVDSAPSALEVARDNATQHGVAARIHFLLGDLLQPLDHCPDTILANLPYVARESWEELQPEICRYEPRDALDGGEGGLEVVQRLLAQASEKLRRNGAILLEIGADQGNRAVCLAHRYFPKASISVLPDYAGLDRVLKIDTS